jgi:hypothetical protein
MSRYQNIHGKMWGSADFRALSAPKPNARDLWIHLLTGTHNTSVPGLFRAGAASLAEELGWSVGGWTKCWKEVEGRGMAVADWTARVVWLPKAFEYRAPQSLNVVKSWRAHIDDIPDCELKTRAILAIADAVEAWDASKDKSFVAVFQATFADILTAAGRAVGVSTPPKASGTPTGEEPDKPSGKASRGAPSPPAEAMPHPVTVTVPVTVAGRERAPGHGTSPNGDPPDPNVGKVLAALQAHESLRDVATLHHAEVACSGLLGGGDTLAEVLQAIAEYGKAKAGDLADSKSGAPFKPPTGRELTGFIRRVRERRGTPQAASARAPVGPKYGPPPKLEGVPLPPEQQRAAAELAAKAVGAAIGGPRQPRPNHAGRTS